MKIFRGVCPLKAMQQNVLFVVSHLDVLCINTAVNYANIGLNNGLSPVWRQTIIETNAGILIIGPWEHILVKFE